MDKRNALRYWYINRWQVDESCLQFIWRVLGEGRSLHLLRLSLRDTIGRYLENAFPDPTLLSHRIRPPSEDPGINVSLYRSSGVTSTEWG